MDQQIIHAFAGVGGVSIIVFFLWLANQGRLSFLSSQETKAAETLETQKIADRLAQMEQILPDVLAHMEEVIALGHVDPPIPPDVHPPPKAISPPEA